VSLLRLIVLKLPHTSSHTRPCPCPEVDKDEKLGGTTHQPPPSLDDDERGEEHLSISNTFPPLLQMVATCRDILEGHVQRLKTKKLQVTSKRKRGVPQDKEQSDGTARGGGGRGVEESEAAVATDQEAMLKLELVLMNVTDCLAR
jgi:hypothetical protein